MTGMTPKPMFTPEKDLECKGILPITDIKKHLEKVEEFMDDQKSPEEKNVKDETPLKEKDLLQNIEVEDSRTVPTPTSVWKKLPWTMKVQLGKNKDGKAGKKSAVEPKVKPAAKQTGKGKVKATQAKRKMIPQVPKKLPKHRKKDFVTVRVSKEQYKVHFKNK